MRNAEQPLINYLINQGLSREEATVLAEETYEEILKEFHNDPDTKYEAGYTPDRG